MTKLIFSIVLGLAFILGFVSLAMYGTDVAAKVLETTLYTLLGLLVVIAGTGVLWLIGIPVAKAVDGSVDPWHVSNLLLGILVATVVSLVLFLSYSIGSSLCGVKRIPNGHSTSTK